MAPVILLLALALLAAGCGTPSEPAGRPNILFILIDDMGYTGPSSFGNEHVQTPHIDSLARDGMKFTAAYALPQCSPTRAELITGQSAARTNFWHVAGHYGYPWARLREPERVINLPHGLPTMPRILQQAGYTTAIFGKWHLSHGQDTANGGLAPEAASHYGFNVADSVSPGSTDDKATRALTRMAIDFIREPRDDPFFCFLSHFTVHTTVAAPQEIIDDYLARGYPPAGPDQQEGRYNATYLAMIKHLDNETGRLLAALDEAGLTANTAVFFLSDNGGVLRCFDNGPFRSGKGMLYEGGIRVPMLVRWPGVVAPGSVTDTPVHVVDYYPTFAEIAGATPPPAAEHPLDGISFLPLLRGEPRAPRALYWHAPLYDLRWGTTPAGAIRDGDYKLIEFFGDYMDIQAGGQYIPGHRVELYNLATDPGETTSLAASDPARRDELLAKLDAWRESVNARMPVENPKHDPARQLEQVRDVREYR